MLLVSEVWTDQDSEWHQKPFCSKKIQFDGPSPLLLHTLTRERGWLHFNANVNVQSLRTDDWAISHHIHHHLGTNTTTNQNQRKNVCCSNVATSVLPSSKKIFSNINTKQKWKRTWIKRNDNHNMKIKATGSWFIVHA